MADFTIAHINIQNVNVIVVFLDQSFDLKPEAEKHEINATLQVCARGAGLAGNVVPVWQDASGIMKFIAPKNQHPYFTSVSYQQLYIQKNKMLSCGRS